MARVATARYSPLMRRLGNPTTMPSAAAISPAAGSVTNTGRPRCASQAAV